jgi:hypothetical protein
VELWDEVRDRLGLDDHGEFGGVIGGAGVFVGVEIDFDGRDLLAGS